jgi:hypothetical protein
MPSLTSPEHLESITEIIAESIDRRGAQPGLARIGGLEASGDVAVLDATGGRTTVRDGFGRWYLLSVRPVCEHVAHGEPEAKAPTWHQGGRCAACSAFDDETAAIDALGSTLAERSLAARGPLPEHPDSDAIDAGYEASRLGLPYPEADADHEFTLRSGYAPSTECSVCRRGPSAHPPIRPPRSCLTCGAQSWPGMPVPHQPGCPSLPDDRESAADGNTLIAGVLYGPDGFEVDVEEAPAVCAAVVDDAPDPLTYLDLARVLAGHVDRAARLAARGAAEAEVVGEVVDSGGELGVGMAGFLVACSGSAYRVIVEPAHLDELETPNVGGADCAVCGAPVADHVGQKACTQPSPTPAPRGLYDLPIFGRMWKADAGDVDVEGYSRGS